MKKSILIIDDDVNVYHEIKESLREDPSTYVQHALSVDEALSAFLNQQFCLVIMDVNLAGIDCMRLLKVMRQAKTIPILVLCAKADSAEKVSLLHAGANAFVEKPYDMEEFTAQAQALMQLYISANPVESRCYTLAFGMDLIIDPTYWRVTLKGEPLDLTHKEFGLLYCLASHKGQVLTKEQLYSHVWNDESEINQDSTIKSHIRTLRQKMAPGGRDYIENVRGVGYRFNVDAADGPEGKSSKEK